MPTSEVQYGVRVTDSDGNTKVRACHSLELARMEAADYNACDWFEADVVRRVIPDWEPVRLAPLAPDAEPTEWVWSAGDVVLDADGIAWQRDGERIYYPWLAVGQAAQRDQDITELVTKHGGRVLVCKARGIGGAS